MDVTEAQLTITLQEAFRCYLAFLSYDQKLRESKLPRQGKDVETTADISTQQYYQSRITAIEASIQYIGKIARRVERWVYEPPAEYYDEEITAETEGENFEALPNEQNSPYLDFFSGCLVYPETPFSAGPSNSNNEAAAKEIDSQVHFQPTKWPRPRVTTPNGVDNEVDNEVDEDMPEGRGRRPDVNISSRTCLGIHPNTSISVNSKNPELSYSSPSSKAPSVGQTTPTSSISANEVDNESSEEESEEDESSEESEEEEEEHEVEDSDSSQDESDESDGGGDTNSVPPEIIAAFQPQNLRDVHDADHAKRIHTAEAKEAEMVERELAEQWAREDEARLLWQRKYAEELRQQERERQETIQKDREAALKAQKEQDEWELAAIARETAAMRAEERKRREEAEAQRVAEQERRSRIEREKRWAEEIKQRNAEEKRKREAEEAERRRRDAEEAQRRQREAEEAQRRQKDREKRKRTIIIDCLACMEPGEREDMAVLPCRHAYCGDCIKDAFKSAYKSRTQFKCCGIPVSTEITPIARYLSPSFTHKYSNLLLELSTRHPKYCSSPNCSRFLPPSLYNAPSITCPKCKTRTCTLCTKREHAGVCKQDKDGIRVEKLAKRKGWKKCPGCSHVVERIEGCLHITCRCGAEWCYACLRDWGECESACGREEMRDVYDPGEGQADRRPRVAPLVAGAMFVGLAMLRERGMRQ